MSTLPDPIVQTTEYRVSWLPMDEDNWDWLHWSLTVEWRGHDKWAVCWAGECLSKSGQWSHERQPSSRTDAWLRTHRFDLETALALAKKAGPKLRVNGKSVADLLAKRAARAAEATS